MSLASFDNSWYRPGRGVVVRTAWYLACELVLASALPWPSRLKVALLRLFGARVGKGVVIKPRVRVKYPWNLEVGDDCWIGEGVWIDSLAPVRLGRDVCLSQGCMIETGNHDWGRTTFDLIVKEVVLEEGAWAAVRSLLLPGSRIGSHGILGAGSVLSGEIEPYVICVGNPARPVRERVVRGGE